MPVYRIKIETPFYFDFIEESVYIESHFNSDEFKLPTSRNISKNYNLATLRSYDKSNYEKFIEENKNSETELCIWDTNPLRDKKWFDLYL